MIDILIRRGPGFMATLGIVVVLCSTSCSDNPGIRDSSLGAAKSDGAGRRLALAAKDMGQASASEQAAIGLYQAFYGKAPSNPTLQSLLKSVNDAGAPALATSLASNAQFSSLDEQRLTRLLLDNLGVSPLTVKTPGSYETLLAALPQLFESYGKGARGQIVLNILNALAGLQSDATWGDAAKAYWAQASGNFAYASNPLSTQDAAIDAAQALPTSLSASFEGNVLLGSPTPDSAQLSVYSETQSGKVWLDYGPAGGSLQSHSSPVSMTAGVPVQIQLDGLAGASRVAYRLMFQAGARLPVTADEATFQLPRAPGSTFTFALQGDSHPERLKTQFDPLLYTRTLQTVAQEQPDFYICMGDDFSVDTLNALTINQSQVEGRYKLQRPYLSIVGRTSPLFLVNGNHEQSARYLYDGTPNNVAVWAQNAKIAYYAQPGPDRFYSGNQELVPYIGLLRNYYAFTWGDALFMVIDPYWGSSVAVDNIFGGGQKRPSMWEVTHGDAQYQWMKQTLEQSKARYKFVFAHHVMGTGRGGVELARLWEWGGFDANGQYPFTAQRPSWPAPIHSLMVANKVTIFFQGHDHIWVRQNLDGVTYQTLSEPADPNYSTFNADAYLTGDAFPNSGYTRVTVSPSGVKVDYVRSYLPIDEGSGRRHGSTAFSYTLP